MHAQALNLAPRQHPLETELNDLIAQDKRMWEFLQHGSLDGVWYWNLENPEEEWMSPELWQLFGIDPATKRHDPAEWQDIIFQEDLALAIENFRKHCEDPSHPYDQIVRYRHADGSTVWVRCRGIAIRDETGKPIRMLGAHNDLTAVKRAEDDAVREKAKHLVANEELKSFAYGVSHDLKSPSRTAKQLIEEVLIEGDRLSSDQRELLGHACETLRRMQVLVDDLLDYGSVVEQEMQWNHVDLNAVTKEAITDLQSDIRASGAILEIDKLPWTNGHKAQLRMMMQNLISNAIKFARPSVAPEVSIVGNVTSDRVVLRVKDNGIGISDIYAQRIFNVFTRLHRGDEIPGSGLGLALCKRIALNHNGSIGLNSKPGEGSTFVISLTRTP